VAATATSIALVDLVQASKTLLEIDLTVDFHSSYSASLALAEASSRHSIAPGHTGQAISSLPSALSLDSIL